MGDPLDMLAPSMPVIGGVGAGAASSAPRVDPFPYGENEQPHDAPYDPYAHAPMQMPDARNYMTTGGVGGNGPYPGYGGGMEGGYGVAAAGAAAYGAHNRIPSQNDHGYNAPSSSSASAPSSAAAAKQREAQNERNRLRTSGQYGPSGSGEGYDPESPPLSDRRVSADPSDTGRSVYQHTDMGSAPDEAAEIPPK